MIEPAINVFCYFNDNEAIIKRFIQFSSANAFIRLSLFNRLSENFIIVGLINVSYLTLPSYFLKERCPHCKSSKLFRFQRHFLHVSRRVLIHTIILIYLNEFGFKMLNRKRLYRPKIQFQSFRKVGRANCPETKKVYIYIYFFFLEVSFVVKLNRNRFNKNFLIFSKLLNNRRTSNVKI